MEGRRRAHFGQIGHRSLVAQQRFRREHNQWLAEIPQHLPAQQVEEIGWGRAVGDLDIVFRAQAQETLDTRRAVFRPLPFVTVRQQHHQTIGAQPLDFARNYKLIDYGLGAIHEIAELGFPQDNALRISQGIAIFETEHAEFRKRAVQHFKARVHRLQRHIAAAILLVRPDRVALAERAAAAILAGQAHAITIFQQRPEGQRLARRPIDVGASGKHLRLGIKNPRQGPVNIETVGHRGQLFAQLMQFGHRNAGHGGAAAVDGFLGLAQPGPAAAEPIGGIGLEASGSVELIFQHGDIAINHGLVAIAGQHALSRQAIRIQLAHRLLLTDHGIHQRLSEARLVAFVVAKPAIAPHVDHHIAAELLPELGGDLGGIGHGFRIIAVHVEDRRLNDLCHVRRIGRRTRKLRTGGEANLVVHHVMDGATGSIAVKP